MSAVRIYGNSTCAYCGAARMLLAGKGVAYEDINVASDPGKRGEMEQLSGRRSVPQIFVGDRHFDRHDTPGERGGHRWCNLFGYWDGHLD